MAVASDGPASIAQSSRSVAQWTLVSRLTGFARAIVIAAILGPTYLGNTFLALNFVPNLTFELLTGSLLGSLLIPALVRRIDAGDQEGVRRIAGSFLGLALAGFTAITVLAIAAGPAIVALLSSTVSDGAVAAEQRHAGFILLVLLMPQVVLYGIAGIGAAIMNAHGRFALAAAAPALENVGIIATMAVYGAAYGTGGSLQDTGTDQLLVLGIGSTAAVGLHAGAQWWGAARVGVRLVPRAGWRDPEVRLLVSRTLPTIGYSALNALRTLSPTVVANAVPGGVVAFYLAQNFFYLPLALGARPIALTFLPRLSRLAQAKRLTEFRAELVGAASLVAFLVVPATAIYLALSVPIARAAALGEIATSHGVELIAVSLASMAVGLLGDATFILATNASYALGNARTPLRGMALRTAVSLSGMGVAIAVNGDVATLVALGLAITLGDLVGATALARWVGHELPRGDHHVRPAAMRALGASAVMLVPACAFALLFSDAHQRGSLTAVAAVGASGGVGLGTYLLVQHLWRSPELRFVLSGFAGRPPRP